MCTTWNNTYTHRLAKEWLTSQRRCFRSTIVVDNPYSKGSPTSAARRHLTVIIAGGKFHEVTDLTVQRMAFLCNTLQRESMLPGWRGNSKRVGVGGRRNSRVWNHTHLLILSTCKDFNQTSFIWSFHVCVWEVCKLMPAVMSCHVVRYSPHPCCLLLATLPH